jgi:hypothetical protein
MICVSDSLLLPFASSDVKASANDENSDIPPVSKRKPSVLSREDGRYRRDNERFVERLQTIGHFPYIALTPLFLCCMTLPTATKRACSLIRDLITGNQHMLTKRLKKSSSYSPSSSIPGINFNWGLISTKNESPS